MTTRSMNQRRFDHLSDGIFAIAMTILVVEIKVPELSHIANQRDLLIELIHLKPLFLSYMLSFITLFTYWKAHHFITSIYAKNIDPKLTNINAIFFFFVALIPFSSHFLGRYSEFVLPVFFFAFNIIFMGLSLYYMRVHAERSSDIKNVRTSAEEKRHARVRILFPVYFAFFSMFISVFSIDLALTVLTLAVLFNLLPSSTKIIDKLLGLK